MTNSASQETITAPAAHLVRSLGVRDLTFLSVVAVANINIVPVVAANGPSTVWLWMLALLFFFLPQGIAVVELSRRFPGEGGLYVWAKQSFGDLHGFLCGWSYWTTNMFFIPTLLFYFIGLVTYVGGPRLGHMAESPALFAIFTVSLLWLTAFANILGIGVGKWVNNIGALGTLVAFAALIILGAVCISKFGVKLEPGGFRLHKLDLGVISSFGVICFGLVGLELGCVMGDEIRNPQKDVPRGVLYGGVLAGLQYLGATLALLLAIRQADMKVLQGVL
ncbi:MAG: APC family permease, partial [Acidobacteriaceae bacterium]|nr:APC family permease [Acidobacteriaceae bacterium]